MQIEAEITILYSQIAYLNIEILHCARTHSLAHISRGSSENPLTFIRASKIFLQQIDTNCTKTLFCRAAIKANHRICDLLQE